MSNLLQILAAVTDRAGRATVEAEFAGSGYGALKTAVAEAVVEFVRPLQERYAELERDPGEVGAHPRGRRRRAPRASRQAVLARVRDAAGLLPRAADGRRTADDDVQPDGTPVGATGGGRRSSSSTGSRSSATRSSPSR